MGDLNPYEEGLASDLANADERIATLTEQLEAAHRDAKEAEAYAAELEAKLAKAVALLHKYCDPMDMSDDDEATLEELKGEHK